MGESRFFVRNQPFSGPVRWFPTRTLAPLDELLGALGCSWTSEGSVLKIACEEKPDSGGSSIQQVSRLELEGRPIRIEQQLQQGRVYVDIDQLAEALQCQFRKSPDGKTLDLYGPLLSQGLGAGAIKGDPSEPGFPLAVEEIQLHREPGSELVGGFLRVRNRGSQVFQRVLVRVSLYEKNGRRQARFAQSLTSLAPQQTASVQMPLLRCAGSQLPVARVEFEAR